MNHQRFETWLLSEESLSPQNSIALEEHMQICQHCQQLKAGWSNVEFLFKGTPSISPRPGFTNRWADRLSLESKKEQLIRFRWQSWILLVGILNVTVLLILILGTHIFVAFENPMQYFLTYVNRLISMIGLVNAVQDVSSAVFQTLTIVVPPGLWAGFAAGLIGLSLLWIFSIQKLSYIPRRSLL